LHGRAARSAAQAFMAAAAPSELTRTQQT
jgi:hypothetical protein